MTILLTDDARARFPSLTEDFRDLESFVSRYDELFVAEFTPSRNRDGRIPADDRVRLLAFSTLAGARQLAWSTIHAINGAPAPLLFLATRAHFEMTGLLAYLTLRFRDYRAGALRERKFETVLNRLHLARLHGLETLPAELAAEVQALKVSKLIGAVDELAKLGPPHRHAFMDSWRFLSEFCHPNSLSRQLAGERRDGQTIRFVREPALTVDEVRFAVGHASISHHMFFTCFDAITHLLNNGDTANG